MKYKSKFSPNVAHLNTNKMKTLKKLSIFTVVIFVLLQDIKAQNVAINTSGNSAYISAILDLSNQNTVGTEGLLPPYVSLTALGTFGLSGTAAQSNGMIVYNTGAGGVAAGLYYWNNTGTTWVAMGGSGGVTSIICTAPIQNTGTTANPIIALGGAATDGILYSTGPATSAFTASAGTTGQVLTSGNGAGPPTWSSATLRSNFYVKSQTAGLAESGVSTLLPGLTVTIPCLAGDILVINTTGSISDAGTHANYINILSNGVIIPNGGLQKVSTDWGVGYTQYTNWAMTAVYNVAAAGNVTIQVNAYFTSTYTAGGVLVGNSPGNQNQGMLTVQVMHP